MLSMHSSAAYRTGAWPPPCGGQLAVVRYV